MTDSSRRRQRVCRTHKNRRSMTHPTLPANRDPLLTKSQFKASEAPSSLAPPALNTPPRSKPRGKRIAMVMFSFYPADPRPRRAVDALRKEGATVDLICLQDEKSPPHERLDGLSVRRISIKHRRSGKLGYLYHYSAFI